MSVAAAIPNLPLLFVIGDSISIHYGAALEQRLSGRFHYDRKRDNAGAPRAESNLDVPNGANGGDSAMVLAYLRQRRAVSPLAVDILLMNCGLHDIKTDPLHRSRQIEAAAYEANLRAIVAVAATMAQSLAWVRLTPVSAAVHNSRQTAFHRCEQDVDDYNAIADRVMAEHHITTFDLHGFTLPFLPAGICDHVHFSEQVREQQAQFLAENLMAWWRSRASCSSIKVPSRHAPPPAGHTTRRG